MGTTISAAIEPLIRKKFSILKKKPSESLSGNISCDRLVLCDERSAALSGSMVCTSNSLVSISMNDRF